MQTNQENPVPEASSQKGAAGSYEDLIIQDAFAKKGRGEIAAAAVAFEDFINRFGGNQPPASLSVLLVELGTLQYWLGDYHSAHIHCEKALQLKNDNNEALVMLGKVAVAQFLFVDARRYFDRVAVEHPGKYLGKALLAIKLRQTNEAQLALSHVASMVSRDFPEYVVLTAYVRLLEGSSLEAVSLVRDKLAACKNDPALLLLIAEIFMTAGNYGEAINVTDQVSVLCPKNDQLSAIRAHAHYAQEDYAHAQADASDAVGANPRNAYAKTVLMKCALRSGDYGYAEQLGVEVVNDAPEYALIHANLGDVYFAQERYEMAELEYDKTNNLMDSQTKGALLRQARMAFMKGETEDATKTLERLIATNHTYYDDAMCDLLLCYKKAGDTEKLETLLEKMELRKSFYHRTEQLLKDFAL